MKVIGTILRVADLTIAAAIGIEKPTVGAGAQQQETTKDRQVDQGLMHRNSPLT
jgi:hypothetical protein